MIIISDKNMLE